MEKIPLSCKLGFHCWHDDDPPYIMKKFTKKHGSGIVKKWEVKYYLEFCCDCKKKREDRRLGSYY